MNLPDIPSAFKPPNRFAGDLHVQEMIQNVDHIKQQQTGGSVKKDRVTLKGEKKVYIVRTDDKKRKYIQKNKQAVYLKDIRGKYAYVL